MFLLLPLLLFRAHALCPLFFSSRLHHQQVTKKEVFEGGYPHLPYGLASMQVKNEKKKKTRLINKEAVVFKSFFKALALLFRSTAASKGVCSLRQEERERRGRSKSTTQQSVFFSSLGHHRQILSSPFFFTPPSRFLDPDLSLSSFLSLPSFLMNNQPTDAGLAPHHGGRAPRRRLHLRARGRFRGL